MTDSASLCLSKRFYGVCLRDWHHVQSHSIKLIELLAKLFPLCLIIKKTCGFASGAYILDLCWPFLQYLAWSLKRSKAVNGCKRVVGVVGKGHLRGIVFALMHDQENLRFKDLVGARGTEGDGQKYLKFFKNLAIETAIGGFIWWAWEATHH